MKSQVNILVLFMSIMLVFSCAKDPSKKYPVISIGKNQYRIAVDSFSPSKASNTALKLAQNYCGSNNKVFSLKKDSKDKAANGLYLYQVTFTCDKP